MYFLTVCCVPKVCVFISIAMLRLHDHSVYLPSIFELEICRAPAFSCTTHNVCLAVFFSWSTPCISHHAGSQFVLHSLHDTELSQADRDLRVTTGSQGSKAQNWDMKGLTMRLTCCSAACTTACMTHHTVSCSALCSIQGNGRMGRAVHQSGHGALTSLYSSFCLQEMECLSSEIRSHMRSCMCKHRGTPKDIGDVQGVVCECIQMLA